MKTQMAILSCAILTLTAALVAISGSTSGEGVEGVLSVSMSIDAKIDNNYATTTVTQALKNPTTEEHEAQFTFNIPQSAFMSSFKMELDGTLYSSKVVQKAAAQEEYNCAKEDGKTASIVESSSTSDTSSFTYRISLKPGENLTYYLTYEEYIAKSKGNYSYSIPLSKNSFPTDGTFSISIELISVAGFYSPKVPAYPEAKIEQPTSSKCLVSLTPESRVFSEDLTVQYSLIEYPMTGEFMNYEKDGVGYFFHVFCPGIDQLGGSGLPKDIIFVMDHSGSMDGQKLDQVKDAFSSIVSDLQPEDRFDIMIYNEKTENWKDEIVDADASNIGSAKTYITGIDSYGSTDIDQAISNALGMFSKAGGVPILCFLTDGLPTSGETNTATIRTNIKNLNTGGVAIFCLAFGDDADFSFLQALALENNGKGTKIDVSSDASDQIQGYYDTFSTPLVTNLTFDYGPGTWDVFPTYVPNLYSGSEVVVVGRYDTNLTQISSDVDGTTSEGLKDFGATFKTAKSDENAFIPRYWAFQKIKDLQEDMLVQGETTALVDGVTDLAVQFQFVTPYTSMILVIDSEPAPEDDDTEGGADTDTGTGYDSPDTDGYVPPGDMRYDTGDDDVDDDCDDDMGYSYADDETDAHNSMVIFPFFAIMAFILLIIIIVVVVVVVYKNAAKSGKTEKKLKNSGDDEEMG